MEIIASVKFNDKKAYVIKGDKPLKFYRLGDNLIYGTDGIRYTCYRFEYMPGGHYKAFGGRKFELKIEDTGEIVKCWGQWWDGGYSVLEKELGLNFTSFTHNTLEELLKCYVFFGSFVDKTALEKLLQESGELFYYNYHEYEKVIKYKTNMENNYKKINTLNRHKKSLITQCKRLSEKSKYFKNQIIIDKWK